MPEDPSDPTPGESGGRGRPPTNWKDLAVDVMARTRNVTKACKAAQVDRSTYYAHLESDPAFRARIDDAMTASVDRLEGAAYKLALAGSERQQQFLLKAWRPEIYNVPARIQHSGPDGGPIEIDAAGEVLDAINRLAARVESDPGTPVVPDDDGTGGPDQESST